MATATASVTTSSVPPRRQTRTPTTEEQIARVRTKFGRRGAIMWILFHDCDWSERDIAKLNVADVCETRPSGPVVIADSLVRKKGRFVVTSATPPTLRRLLRGYLIDKPPTGVVHLDYRVSTDTNPALFVCRYKRHRGASHGYIGEVLRRIGRSEEMRTLQQQNASLQRHIAFLS